MISAVGLLLAVYWGLAALVLGTDPFDLYPWGVRVWLPQRHIEADLPAAGLIVAKDHTSDLVMIGSSPAFRYEPDDIRRVFPSAQRPWNFSYFGGRPRDQQLVLQALADHSAINHLVLWLDWFQTLPEDQVRSDFPTYLYDQTHLDDLRMVNLAGLEASWRLLTRGAPFATQDSMRKWLSEWQGRYQSFQTPSVQAQLAALVEAGRRNPAGLRRSCDDFQYISRRLLPILRAFSRRGVKIDLIIPAYSAAFYYSVPEGGTDYFRPGLPFLRDQLQARRCLAEATQADPLVDIWALDMDIPMISALSNYRDPGHLQGLEVLKRSFDHVGDPAYRLTTANFEAYADRLEQAVTTLDLSSASR